MLTSFNLQIIIIRDGENQQTPVYFVQEAE